MRGPTSASTKYVLQVNRRGRIYYYFRPGRALARYDIPAIRLADDAAKAATQAALMQGLTNDPSPIAFYRHVGGLLHDARQRARRDNIAFELTGVDIVLKLMAQECRCALSDLRLDLALDDEVGARPLAPRLNRISPELGYTPQNIQIVAVAVGTVVEEWGLETLRKIANGLAKRARARAVEATVPDAGFVE
jgi:hypothetical protein